ncbi:Zinc fingerC2H2 type family protein [Aphelenchoides avenae]|nr:Zinc fingerC2H2 type family protein [Aphelenchus avenae]
MAYKDYGPVEFRFDSSQRKNPVIIYDSRRCSGKTSEWYFVRRNNTTCNETYRCVHCRAVNEKAKRYKANATPKQPGARIVIKQDRFMTDPDEPLGVHICNFEYNESSDTHVVWGRRALLKANSELRVNPERPKQKFDQLIEDIQTGRDFGRF